MGSPANVGFLNVAFGTVVVWICTLPVPDGGVFGPSTKEMPLVAAIHPPSASGVTTHDPESGQRQTPLWQTCVPEQAGPAPHLHTPPLQVSALAASQSLAFWHPGT